MSVALRDTAGQERYASLAPLYYRGASAACVVYDITNAESFQKAKHWVSELQKNASGAIGERFLPDHSASARCTACQGIVSALQEICCRPHEVLSALDSHRVQCMGGVLAACTSVPASLHQRVEELFKAFHDGHSDGAVIILVGNKSDLTEQREVTTEAGQEYAER